MSNILFSITLEQLAPLQTCKQVQSDMRTERGAKIQPLQVGDPWVENNTFQTVCVAATYVWSHLSCRCLYSMSVKGEKTPSTHCTRAVSLKGKAKQTSHGFTCGTINGFDFRRGRQHASHALSLPDCLFAVKWSHLIQGASFTAAWGGSDRQIIDVKSLKEEWTTVWPAEMLGLYLRQICWQRLLTALLTTLGYQLSLV